MLADVRQKSAPGQRRREIQATILESKLACFASKPRLIQSFKIPTKSTVYHHESRFDIFELPQPIAHTSRSLLLGTGGGGFLARLGGGGGAFFPAMPIGAPPLLMFVRLELP